MDIKGVQEPIEMPRDASITKFRGPARSGGKRTRLNLFQRRRRSK